LCLGHFADHPVEDIIEKIACQFTARHIRGRPRPPSWYLGWPLYVCDSRYNDRERIFVKIKNWNSCVPEEVRKSADFMPIYPFERMVFPRRFGSPFLKGTRVRGPGGIGESVDRAEGERIEGGGTGRKRSRKPGAPTDISGPSKGLYVGVGPATVPGTPAQPAAYAPLAAGAQPRAEDRSIVTAAGGAAVLGNNASMEKLSAETGS
jgi:chromatin structure-remodeling complex subunit RSC1/2